jgi:hypothetical protein
MVAKNLAVLGGPAAKASGHTYAVIGIGGALAGTAMFFIALIYQAMKSNEVSAQDSFKSIAK